MSEVIERFFAADEQFTRSILAEYKDRTHPAAATERELKENFGCDCVMMRRALSHRWACGIAFAIESREAAEEKRGWILEVRDLNGKSYATYTPNRRYKEGKALDAALKRLSEAMREDPEFTDWVVGRLNIRREICGADLRSRTGMSIYLTAAGIAKGRLVARIPTGGDEEGDLPDLPPELVEIKKSEFIALTEE